MTPSQQESTMTTKPILFLIIAFAGTTLLAFGYLKYQEPTTREECYLNNLRDVQSDTAARMINIACNRQFPEPPNIFDQFDPSTAGFDPVPGTSAPPISKGTPIPGTNFRLTTER